MSPHDDTVIPAQWRHIKDGTICTVSGVQFDVFDPKPEHITIEDIAHGLSNECRFAGHTRNFYSVAQHSVLVAERMPGHRAAQLIGLLHDASEAYLGDMPRPIKRKLKGFQVLESRVQHAVWEAFGVSQDEVIRWVHRLKKEDNHLLMVEQRDLMPDTRWWPKAELTDPVISPWTPSQAKTLFLEFYYEEMIQA